MISMKIKMRIKKLRNDFWKKNICQDKISKAIKKLKRE